jgi:hypothetical protein
MADGELWFGVVNGTRNHFQWVPQPDLPVSARRAGYFDSMQFENGGAAVVRSHGYHREFDFNIGIDRASSLTGIDAYADFASGLYGDGLISFADPFYYEQNLAFPALGSPALSELDWPEPVAGSVSWGDTAANSYSQPQRKGTWTITTDANATPLTDATIPFFIFPIPPDMTLHLGCTGAATGTAVCRVESWVNHATSAGATASLTLLSETGSTRLNTTVAGATYAFAKVYFTRTSSAASTITPISLVAQLWPAATSPTLTGLHVPGRGHSGLKFADDAVAEDYALVAGGVPYRGLSTRLVEVGAWET